MPTLTQAAWAVPRTYPSPSLHPLCHVLPVHLSVTACPAHQETPLGDSLPLVSLPAEINEEMQLFKLGIWVESKQWSAVEQMFLGASWCGEEWGRIWAPKGL